MSNVASNAPAMKMQSSSAAGSGRSWRRGVALAGVAALLVETIAALMQAPRAEPLRMSGRTSLDWWRYPIERNAIQRMPVLRGRLLTVYALRGTDDVWFAGEGGLILHSGDSGRTWDSTNVSAVPQREAAPAAATVSRKTARARRRASGGSPTRTSLASLVWPRQGKAPQSQEKTSSYQQEAAKKPPMQQQSVEQVTQVKRVAVPSVVGFRTGTAEKILASAALRARLTETPVQDSARVGLITSQSPSAGIRVLSGTVVSLRVGRYAPVAQQNPPVMVDSQAAVATPPVTQPPADTTSSLAFYPGLYGICVTASGRGWAVGSNGAAFRSVDRGRTWRQVATGVQFSLTSLACNGTFGAIAAGTNGIVRLRPDSASAEIRSRMRERRSHLVLGTGDTLWAGDYTNALRHSTDTGRTWQVADPARRSIATADSRTWFATDSTGRVSVSRDGGRWEQRSGCTASGVREFESRIVPASATVALKVDGAGQMFRTSDGWLTCTPVLELDGALSQGSVSPASEDVWYAVADGGAFRSVDGGSTWHSLIAPLRFASILFRDSLHGVAGLHGHRIATTSDGGRAWSVSALDGLRLSAPNLLAQRTDDELYSIKSDLGFVRESFVSRDGGRSWSIQRVVDSIAPVVFTSAETGWGLRGLSDSTWTTADGGATWRRARPTGPLGGLTKIAYETLGFLRDGRGGISQMWVTDDGNKLMSFDGTRWDTLATGILAASPVTPSLAYGLDSLGNLIRSANGGRAWSAVDVAPPRKYPAPWYYAMVALTVAGTLATARARRPSDAEAEESIADILVSDRPLREGDRDVLDFGKMAAGLSRFIRNTRTEPPLTIAVTGPWGTGKSSLMNLLRRDLERRGFRTIWFNAWHHQREESLLASLLEAIRRTATPPVWTPIGIRFRLRLLGKRFHRYRALVILLPVFAWAIGYILKDPHRRFHEFEAGVGSVSALFTSDKADKSATPQARDSAATSPTNDSHPITAPEGTAIALIVSIIGTILTYVKGLKAFGVKPGEVAKSVVSAGSVRTIESQPAFRYRFAQDFSEVTQALKPERLVIFVDDLDRCKPEQVLEILESINFLVESGDCVVVLGIDRERVTGCVAIGFKEVATVLAQASVAKASITKTDSDAASATKSATVTASEAKPDISPAITTNPGIGGASAAKSADTGANAPVKSNLDYQLEYASHYLEKLLNMEIPIPPATPEGLGNVMTNTGAPRLEPDDVPPDAGEEALAGTTRRRRGRIYAAAVGLLTVGFFLRGFLGPGTPAPSTVVAHAPVAAAAESVAPDTSRIAPVTPRDTTSVPTDRTLRREPMLLVAGTVPSTAWWMHAALALVAMTALLWLVTPREDNRVEDSAAFATALRAWAPVLFEEHPTPRSAKKFLNKMRFLSMAQRTPVARRAPVETLLDRLSTIPWLGSLFARTPREEPQDTLLPDAIPEVTLVSLNVIRDRYPEWLHDKEFWKCDLHEYVSSRVDPIPAEIQKALDGLGEIQTRLSMEQHREAWRRLELWVRD